MLHGASQQPIRFGLIPAAISLKPGNYVGVQAHRYRLLLGPVELADFRSFPIRNRWRVGKINVLVSFCGDGFDISFLSLCELPHKPSFRGTPLREPK